MTKQFNGLVCVGCGGNLDLEISFTGADWDCAAGEGSGFDHEIRLACNKKGCGRTYHIGNVKDERHFSPSLTR